MTAAAPRRAEPRWHKEGSARGRGPLSGRRADRCGVWRGRGHTSHSARGLRLAGQFEEKQDTGLDSKYLFPELLIH